MPCSSAIFPIAGVGSMAPDEVVPRVLQIQNGFRPASTSART